MTSSGGQPPSPTSNGASYNKRLMVPSHRKNTKQHASISFPLDRELQDNMRQHLGDGPMRFGPAVVPTEMNVRQQLVQGQSLQLTTYVSLRTLSDVKKKYRQATDEQVLRIVQFCNYHDAMAYDLLKKCKPHYFHLTSSDRQRDIEEKRLVVPIPYLALRQKPRSRVVYFRPSRFSPRHDSKSSVIDSLVYILDNWTRNDAIVWTKHSFSSTPVTYCLLVHLHEFESSNYNKDYWSKFMALLQGRVFPVRVGMVLWVDPPPSFNRVWTSMKNSMMLSKEFAKNNFRLGRNELWQHFERDFERYLPSDEFPDLNPNTSITLQDMAHDYLMFQKFIETLEGRSPNHEVLAKKRQTRRRRMHLPRRKKRPSKINNTKKATEGRNAVDESDRRQGDESESRNVDESESHTPYDDDDDDDQQDMHDEKKDDYKDDDDQDDDDDDDVDLSSFDNDSASEPSRTKRKGGIRKGLLKIKLRRKNKNNRDGSNLPDRASKPPLSPRRASRPVVSGLAAGHPMYNPPRRSSLSILDDMKEHMAIEDDQSHNEQGDLGSEQRGPRRSRRPSLFGGMKTSTQGGDGTGHQRKVRRSSLFGGAKESVDGSSDAGSISGHRKNRRSSLFGGMKDSVDGSSDAGSFSAQRKPRRSSLFGGMKEPSDHTEGIIHRKPRRSSLLGGMKGSTKGDKDEVVIANLRPRRSSLFGSMKEPEAGVHTIAPGHSRRASLTMLGEIQQHVDDHSQQHVDDHSQSVDTTSIATKSPRQRRRRMSITGMFAKMQRNRGGSKGGNDLEDASLVSDSVRSHDFDQSFNVANLANDRPAARGAQRYSAHQVASSSPMGNSYHHSESTNNFEDSQNSSNSQDWDKILSDMHRQSTRGGLSQASPETSTPTVPANGRASRRFSTATIPIDAPPLTSTPEEPPVQSKANPPKLSYFLEQVERQKERTKQLQMQRLTGNATIS